jgi:uncharacterized protein (TIGR02147 family)
MALKPVFEFEDYKTYLAAALAPTGATRGSRSKLASALNCQTAFVSRVLNGDAHFSFEHTLQVARFLSLSSDETNYFFLLVQRARAGSADLTAFYTQQIEAFRRRRELIAERIQVKTGMSAEDQMTFFSSWHFAAVHVLLNISSFQNRAAIAKHLNLPLEVVGNCVDFLVRVGLATEKDGVLQSGVARLHLSKDSPMIAKHHTNWRMRAIESLDRERPKDLHYSSVISVTRKNAAKIREQILRVIESTEPLLSEAHEEAAYVFTIDLFELGGSS